MYRLELRMRKPLDAVVVLADAAEREGRPSRAARGRHNLSACSKAFDFGSLVFLSSL